MALALLLLVATGALAGPSERAPAAPLAPALILSNTISYQGRLLDSGGNPVNGTQVMTFSLYTTPSGGSPLWSQAQSVTLDDGLFTAYLEVWPAHFNGQQLWLGVQLQGEAEMTPRQPILPAPYALSLRPGAVISGSRANVGALNVVNGDRSTSGGYGISAINYSQWAWRPAIYGENNGASAGIYGRSDGWHGAVGWNVSDEWAGVYGRNNGGGRGVFGENVGAGYGGYFTSTEGIGLFGGSSGGVGIGVLGRGTFGVQGESTDGFGVSGISTNDVGIHGVSVNGTAAFFTSTHGVGVHANAQGSQIAVLGENRGDGAGGYFTSTHGVGLAAASGDGHAFATLGPSLIRGPNPMQVALLRWYPVISTPMSLTVGAKPQAIAFDGANIWVVNHEDDTVSVLRANSGEQVMTVTTDTEPEDIAFDGVNMWVLNIMNITVVRASDGVQVMTPTVGILNGHIAFDGVHMWVTDPGYDRIYALRLSDGSVVMTRTVGDSPGDIAFDGTHIWVTNKQDDTVSVLRASDGAHVMTVTVGSYPVGLAFDGANMWVANYNDDTVSVVRASDGTLVTTIVSPTVGPDPIALAFDGANMWVVNENAYGDRGSVSIIRVVDHTLVATVPVGKEPEAIAFDGANMWIANFYDDTVSKR